MKKRINTAKANYWKFALIRVNDKEIATKLFPDSTIESAKVMFHRLKTKKTMLKKEQIEKIAAILHCNPLFLSGAEKYSFIKLF